MPTVRSPRGLVASTKIRERPSAKESQQGSVRSKWPPLSAGDRHASRPALPVPSVAVDWPAGETGGGTARRPSDFSVMLQVGISACLALWLCRHHRPRPTSMCLLGTVPSARVLGYWKRASIYSEHCIPGGKNSSCRVGAPLWALTKAPDPTVLRTEYTTGIWCQGQPCQPRRFALVGLNSRSSGPWVSKTCVSAVANPRTHEPTHLRPGRMGGGLYKTSTLQAECRGEYGVLLVLRT